MCLSQNMAGGGKSSSSIVESIIQQYTAATHNEGKSFNLSFGTILTHASTSKGNLVTSEDTLKCYIASWLKHLCGRLKMWILQP